MDKSLPDYANDPSEFDSTRKVVYRKPIEIAMKLITHKVLQAHNLVALESLKGDVQHSILAGNVAAKTEIKKIINRRAAELGFKGEHGGVFW
ncbi:MAG: hypothetical protein Q8R25_04315 [bacterium]|nr:hypothetical protein [bacterium]